GGMTFTSAVAGSGTPAAPLVSTTAAATAGTASTAAGASDYAAALAFQVGADNNANNQVSVDLTAKYTTTALGLGTGDLLTQAAAQTYIDTAKTALNTLITQRADLGATQNQLNFVQANLATSIEQSTAAVSSIRDADMAAEMANFTKNQILTQAGTSMLAQANQAAQNVLSLFR
ncbi:MAG: flagellar protein, partial [Zetaproteobacteria bacterium CG_4_9_14_3_um_filter_53_7]